VTRGNPNKNRSMTNKNVTLNDFFSSLKHLFYPPSINRSTFAAVNNSTNQNKETNETNKETDS